jgi:hypothetical protein
MARTIVKLNDRAYKHARALIEQRKVVLDERDAWSEHQPSAAEENRYIEEHGLGEYSKWFLGLDEHQDEDNKGRYKFPYGDFQSVHRCGVLSAESRAAQYKHSAIDRAAAHLHGMLETLRSTSGTT